MTKVESISISNKHDTAVKLPNHDEVYKRLITGPLSSNIAGYVFPNNKKGSKIYSRGSYKIREDLSRELQIKMNKKCIEYDIVIMLSSLKASKNSNFRQAHRTIAVEIKTTKRDLKLSFQGGSHSFEKYMGVTDYFFIAVPSFLLSVLIKQLKQHDNRKSIGVIDADRGFVVVMPQRQKVDGGRMNNVLSHCFTSVHNLLECENGLGLFSVNRVGSLSGTDNYSQCAYIKGLLVNKNYYSYFD